MKTILSMLAILALSFQAFANDLPSEMSGTYVGGGPLAGWQCDIRAYALQPSGLQSHVLAVDCGTPAGRAGGAVSVWDQCPSAERTPVPLVPYGSPGLTPTTPRMAILSYTTATAGCPLGEILVNVGDSPAYSMCRIQIIIPTYPYPGCGAPSPRPRIRVFGR